MESYCWENTQWKIVYVGNVARIIKNYGIVKTSVVLLYLLASIRTITLLAEGALGAKPPNAKYNAGTIVFVVHKSCPK